MKIEFFSQNERFTFDVRRSILLSAYMAQWGMPEYRVILSKTESNVYIEMYLFPDRGGVSRFVTIGMSNTCHKSGQPVASEWMLALPSDLGGEKQERIFNYFADLIAHHIENATDASVPLVMSSSALAPENWNAKALLIDELRGESDSLEELTVGSEVFPLLWAVPITEKEAAIILEKGIEHFDEIFEKSDYSIIDPCRP
ncbi:Suppressor of fused protein (SUFU) [Paenibacillus algorifonticola]|uniref:Suppressor of fused protein (SUFU) n=1 Tax=Paenibacillus algorifonticola TaxID=684063 RepID=A0A1I2GHX1_9BACL|nr:suppressor of fused domain protein [Paenibacillus algorifonticola]SFF16838.1 Suppressor of fused protein (SUFU) [Paenibacillus algorifonticola]